MSDSVQAFKIRVHTINGKFGVEVFLGRIDSGEVINDPADVYRFYVQNVKNIAFLPSYVNITSYSNWIITDYDNEGFNIYNEQRVRDINDRSIRLLEDKFDLLTKKSCIWTLSSTRTSKYCYVKTEDNTKNAEIVIWIFAQFTGGIHQIANQEPLIETLYFKYSLNGSEFTYEISSTPIFKSNYSPTFNYTIATDINDKKYLQIEAVNWCSLILFSNKSLGFLREI